jgi:hypothetical protein
MRFFLRRTASLTTWFSAQGKTVNSVAIRLSPVERSMAEELTRFHLAATGKSSRCAWLGFDPCDPV